MTEGGRARQDKGRGERGGEKKVERVCDMTIVIFVMSRGSQVSRFWREIHTFSHTQV